MFAPEFEGSRRRGVLEMLTADHWWRKITGAWTQNARPWVEREVPHHLVRPTVDCFDSFADVGVFSCSATNVLDCTLSEIKNSCPFSCKVCLKPGELWKVMGNMTMSEWAMKNVQFENWAHCRDDVMFVDAMGFKCIAWTRLDCTHLLGREYTGAYTADEVRNVRRHCPATCGLCRRAPGRGRGVNGAPTGTMGLDTVRSRLVREFEAVLQQAPDAGARHLAVGDAALLFMHAFAVERAGDIARIIAAARVAAVVAYRAATALGDGSIVAEGGAAFEVFVGALQADTEVAAWAYAEVGQMHKAESIFRAACTMQPWTESGIMAKAILAQLRIKKNTVTLPND